MEIINFYVPDFVTGFPIYKKIFDLWKEYPNKQGKEKAFKGYVKVRTKEKVDLSDIVNGLKRYLVYCKPNKEQYSPKNGSTWFNQYSWNDEYPIKEITTKDLAKNMDFSDF